MPTSRSSLTSYANGIWSTASDLTQRIHGRRFWQAVQTLLGNLGPRRRMTTLMAAVREKADPTMGNPGILGTRPKFNRTTPHQRELGQKKSGFQISKPITR